jgi:hypothetical protein
VRRIACEITSFAMSVLCVDFNGKKGLSHLFQTKQEAVLPITEQSFLDNTTESLTVNIYPEKQKILSDVC